MLGGAMTSPILVTGGTGTLGRLVVRRLGDAGYKARVLSRRSHKSGDGTEFMIGDLASGEGIEPAVDGVETIVHLADSAMFGYFASKLAAEKVIEDSGLPWTMLRATQFHEGMLTVAQQMVKLPVIPLPVGFCFQPVEADEVAARLVELTLGEPSGLVPDMGGPRVYGAAELLRGYLRATKQRRLIVPVWPPGKAAREFRAGANLAFEQAVGQRTWEEFLAENLSQRRPTPRVGTTSASV